MKRRTADRGSVGGLRASCPEFAGLVPASRGAHCRPLHPRLASSAVLSKEASEQSHPPKILTQNRPDRFHLNSLLTQHTSTRSNRGGLPIFAKTWDAIFSAWFGSLGCCTGGDSPRPVRLLSALSIVSPAWCKATTTIWSPGDAQGCCDLRSLVVLRRNHRESRRLQREASRRSGRPSLCVRTNEVIIHHRYTARLSPPVESRSPIRREPCFEVTPQPCEV